MATFKAVVFRSQNHRKSDGTSNIKIRIYHNRESQYVPTKYYLDPDLMANSGEILEDYPGSDILNFEIQNVIQEYRKICIRLGSSRLNRMTCSDIKQFITGQEDKDLDIIDFVKFSKVVIDKTEKFKTAEWYTASITALKWYFKKDVIDVRDINYSRLTDFIERLRKGGPKGKPLEARSITNYLQGIRALLNKCKLHYNNDELDIIRIPNDPFSRIKMLPSKRKRKNIGVEEIKLIRDRLLLTERENIGRDIFMMQYYLMGININDLFNLDPPVRGRVNYYRSKTNTEENVHGFLLSIKVEPELDILFKKYSVTGFLSEIKNRYSCSYGLMKASNKGLKLISDALELPKVTTNWARHSWASIARNKAGISKPDIDFCLGHVNKDYKMADIYIEIDYSIYDKTNRKVLDLLVDKKPINKKVKNVATSVAK